MHETNSYQRRVFGDKEPERRRIIDNCRASTSLVANRIASKLNRCCQSPSIHADPDGTNVKLAEQRCKSRICPRCTQFRTWRLIARMLPLVKLADSPRFLTLTVKHSNAPLADQVKAMCSAFAKLRRSKQWKQNVDGGLYTLEIKWSPKTAAWHPHIHAIIDGRFYPHAQLKSAWQNVTGGSSIVDIRQVNSRRNAVTYVAKYAAKAAETKGIPDTRIAEWATAMHGLRMAQTFGTMHNVKVDRQEDDETFPQHAAFLGPVILAADNGEELADQLLDDVVKLTNRRVPDADPVAAEKHVDALKKVVSRVRAFAGHHKEIADADAARIRNVQTRGSPVSDRPQRLWQDDDNQPHRVGLPD